MKIVQVTFSISTMNTRLTNFPRLVRAMKKLLGIIILLIIFIKCITMHFTENILKCLQRRIPKKLQYLKHGINSQFYL